MDPKIGAEYVDETMDTTKRGAAVYIELTADLVSAYV